MLTDAQLWKIASDARIRAAAGEREAKDDPNAESQARWMKAKAESERLARQWQRRIGGTVQRRPT
jgi:hypothetical protein